MDVTPSSATTALRLLTGRSGKQEEKLVWKWGNIRVYNSRVAGLMMDLWPALWASGVGGVAGSERLGVRGHGAERFVGWGGTAAGHGLEFGNSPKAH